MPRRDCHALSRKTEPPGNCWMCWLHTQEACLHISMPVFRHTGRSGGDFYHDLSMWVDGCVKSICMFFLILRNCFHLGISFKGNLFDAAEELGPVTVTETRSFSSESGWISRSRSTRSILRPADVLAGMKLFHGDSVWIGSRSAPAVLYSRSVGYLISKAEV